MRDERGVEADAAGPGGAAARHARAAAFECAGLTQSAVGRLHHPFDLHAVEHGISIDRLYDTRFLVKQARTRALRHPVRHLKPSRGTTTHPSARFTLHAPRRHRDHLPRYQPHHPLRRQTTPHPCMSKATALAALDRAS